MKPKFSKRDRRDKDAPPKVRRAPGTPTKSQLRAAANAEVLARISGWKNLIPAAKAQWGKLDAIELTRAEGNPHVLAGLVQMRYQLGREEADRQVKAFFEKNASAAPKAAAAPAVVRTAEAAA